MEVTVMSEIALFSPPIAIRWTKATPHGEMNWMKSELSWWRLLLGLLLVYTNVKFLLLPQTRTFQPANAGEATGMLITDILLVGVGIWLLATCYRAPRVSGPK